MHNICLRVLAAFAALALPLAATAQEPARMNPSLDSTPRIGVLVPKLPNDYRPWLDALQDKREESVGPFKYLVGEIDHVPVVLIIQDVEGVVARALGAQAMFEHYNIRTVVYPGTSGAELEANEMLVGDIVLGAKNIIVNDFYMGPDGAITGGSFATTTVKRSFSNFYADPKLLSMMACSATQEAARFTPPTWLNPTAPKKKPTVFYYGVQGTTTSWIEERGLFDKIRHHFGHVAEDGDWYSNLTAVLYKVPFIEVSVIANSQLEFPGVYRGQAPAPAGEKGGNFVAQDISNRIALNFIRRYGQTLLTGVYGNPQENPFPEAFYNDPKSPRGLIDGMTCR